MIHIPLICRKGSTQLSANVTFSFHWDETRQLQDLMQLQQRWGSFSIHVEVFSMYSCRDKKGRVGGFLCGFFFPDFWVFLFGRRKIRMQSNSTAIFPLTQRSTTPETNSASHTGEPWKHPQKMPSIWKALSKWWIVLPTQTAMASNEIENIYLWKITASSCYQSPFVSTNSNSFLSKK